MFCNQLQEKEKVLIKMEMYPVYFEARASTRGGRGV